jgi:hypothetical protein
MRKGPEPPPELADAIEFTAEFRDAMGLHYGDGESEVVTEVPSDEELAHIPEWQAVNAMITAEEYLACFGYAPQPFTPVRHGLRGRPGSRRKRK